MHIKNVPLLTPEKDLDEISTHLECSRVEIVLKHSLQELAQSVISSINPDLTDLSTLTYVHALLLD